MTIESRSPRTTAEVAGVLAKEILKYKKRNGAFVVGLVGNLGSGKTTFIQGFARGLGIKKRILSPSFLILKRYRNFYHIDAYRIKKPNELESLGFKEIIRSPKNIVFIEWADKIRKILPKKSLLIDLRHGRRENERIIQFGIKNTVSKFSSLSPKILISTKR